MTNATNVLINVKKGRTANYPFDDPNYMPRVVTETYKRKVKDAKGNVREVEREKSKLTSPIGDPDTAILKDMNALPYQRIPGMPNPNNMSSRKNPRIVNNSPKFISRTRKGKTRRIQVRGIAIKRLSKEAVKLIKEGNRKDILTKDNKISKRYVVTRLKGTKRDSGLKFNGFKPKKKKD